MDRRILALDLGEKRLGLAVSDPEGLLAGSHWVYPRRNIDEDLEYLRRLVEEEGIGEIVLGLPENMDGSLGEQAKRALEFKRLLEARLGLPVALVDERLTTAEAERVLLEANLSRKKRRRLRDGLAAALILQAYLEHRAREREER
ncbi:MAG: Holliday junction resolvase RuvX [Candidatus Acetothermia bacterium]|jgi:putative Holliday junction resolvase|nr:Holliday junction resolvase RuvX [Candidatus Acetothermia bacterium]MDH7504808.1 Holliday junction resolvase RuvX [Candidatus Acetothermia bacterium]